MDSSFVLAPSRDGAGHPERARVGRAIWHAAILFFCIAPVRAADLTVLGGPSSHEVGVAQLEAGAGSSFRSPVATDVLVAVLIISNTGGASWNLSIAREGNELSWPAGMRVLLKRSGGSAEAGISDGLSYRALTTNLEPFFSGSGDYASVEILLRLDGVMIDTPPGLHSLTIRYAIDVS